MKKIYFLFMIIPVLAACENNTADNQAKTTNKPEKKQIVIDKKDNIKNNKEEKIENKETKQNNIELEQKDNKEETEIRTKTEAS